WWSKNTEADREIRHRFEALVLRAEDGVLDPWRSTIQGKLALILLTDQFPRNIYRDTADAFRFDHLARSVCLESLETRAERDLRPIQRLFFYLPLEHSEDGDHQHLCVSLVEELAADVPVEDRSVFEGFVDFALRHKAIIDRFGRYPHRNEILGRSSTPLEEAFLQQPGSSF
ncbi:MAG: DUF924 family protein, partial [Pseudomonadota bacterium]